MSGGDLSTLSWQATMVRDLLVRHEVRCLFLGLVAAHLHGLPEPTAAIDLLVDPAETDRRGLRNALRELGLAPTAVQEEQLARGVGVVRFAGSGFDLRLHLSSPGIRRFNDAWWRRVELDGFPVCHLDDVLAHAEQSAMPDDLEALPRLRLLRRQRLQTPG